ncbi:MAG: ATP synthase F1 subunit gamma [Dehalococcoidia bacterium]|nr:ATP synthase F1 subunit gamma [Dehalococcoidia bacterium]
MPNIRLIQRRIKSVSSTARITKAMEMEASSKMRKAQQRVLASRPFAVKMGELLGHLAAQLLAGDTPHPLLEHRATRRIGVLHVTADRGLIGSLNANMNRRTASFLLSQETPATLITIGRKGREFMVRYGRDLRADFAGFGDQPGILDIAPVARIVIDDYLDGRFDEVYLAYSEFVSTMSQKPVVQRLLPVEPLHPGGTFLVDFLYEPSAEAVLAQLLPRYVEMQIYHAVLEHISSEHSARMVAMRNATDNANELIDDLTLYYNKARQETITKELLDIVGGAAALA